MRSGGFSGLSSSISDLIFLVAGLSCSFAALLRNVREVKAASGSFLIWGEDAFACRLVRDDMTAARVGLDM